MLGLSLPYIDADSSSDQDQASKKEKKIKMYRGRSDDTGSWMTVDYEEYTVDTELPLSDTGNKTSRSKRSLDQQSTFEESSASLMEFLKHESMSQLFSETETERDGKVTKEPKRSADLSLKFKNKNKIIVTPPQENSPTIENLPFIDASTSRSIQKSESGEQTGSSGSANDISPTEQKNEHKTLLTAKSRRSELLKLSAERSRSSESTSWTSIEKDVSPSSANIKGSSIDDESSVSCSIARPLGISQDIEKLNKKDRECLEELKQAMEYGEEHLVSHHTLSSEHSKSNSKSPSPIPELGRIESPRSPSKISTRKSPTPTLEKQGQVDSLKAPTDSESSSESIDRTVEQLSKPNIRKSGLEKIGKCVIEESESSQSAASKASDIKNDLQLKKTKIAITISQEDQNTTIDFDDDGNVITSSFERELMKKRALKDVDQKSSSKSSMDTTTTTTPSKGSLSVDDSSSRRKARLDEQKSSSKSSMDSRGSLSVESRGSFETTESTSGSLGEAYRRGEELKPTWRPFFGASGSENSTSIEEAWIPQDHDGYESLTVNKDVFEYNNQRMLDDFQTFSKNPPLSANTSKDSTEADFTDDLNDFPVNFLYPATSSASTDVVIGYGQNFGRTLSRISERSTASEKTSADEDSTKACSRSESINEESLNSSDHQASLSSDPPSNANVAYISDTDRRTSAEMPDIPIDQAKISEMYSESRKEAEKINKKGEASQETKKVEDSTPKKGSFKAPCKQSSASESQESEDWPLPELPPQAAKHDASDLNRRKSSEFEDWPSLPSSLLETPIVEKVHIYYMSNEPEQAMKVTIQSESSKCHLESDDDSDTLNNDEDLERDVQESKSEKSPDKATDETSKKPVKAIPYDQSGYMVEPLEKQDEITCLNKGVVQNYDKSCLSGTLSKATCLMGDVGSCCSRAEHKSFAIKSNIEDKVIISQPLKSPNNHSPNFDEDHLYADDVFGGDSKSLSPDFDKGFSQQSAQKFSCGSNNSDTSIDDLLSQTNADETVRVVGKVSTGSADTCKRCSHSSHSEEETSSFGTDLDGTVKIGLPPKKCTHSSHSEDTSICLSISEWSTGTNTVRQYANLSASESVSAISIAKSDKSENATTKLYSSGKLSKKSEHKPKIGSHAEASSKSSSIDKSSDNIKYDKLCSSDTTVSRKGIDSSSGTKSDSTLTLAQSISEWSASTSHTLVATAREDPQEVEEVKPVETFEATVTTAKSEERAEAKPPTPKCESPIASSDIKEPVLRLTASYTGKHDKSSSISYSDKSDKSSSSSLSSLQKHTNGILRFDQRLKGFQHPQDKTHERYLKTPPKSLSYEEQSRRYTQPAMRCQSEDSDFKPYSSVASQPEIDIDMPSQLYSQEEKHSERYQSQEFSNIIREDTSHQYVRSDYKPLAKHASYDDKTLSKNQIKEYKISQQYRSKPKSWSFHEHYLATSSELPIITVPEMPMVHKELQERKSAERSGKTPLSRCSPYYSSSLSSESPPIQPLKAPVKKSLLVRNISLKSPPSGNDTDSSLDVIRDPRERMKTFRRKKPVASARKRHEKIQDVLEEDSTKSQCSSESDKLHGGMYLTVEDNLRRIESSECSDSYLPEVESGSSEAKDTQEPVSYSEDDEQTEFTSKYKSAPYEPQKFPINITPVKFQGFGSSADEDEMGFPRFDRLGRLRHPYLDSQEPSYVPDDSPPRTSYSNKSSRQSSLKKVKPSSMFRQSDDKSPGEPSSQRPKFYDESSDRDDSDDYAYPIDTIKRAPKSTKTGRPTMFDREAVAYSDTELSQDKDEYEEYRGSPYPERYEEMDTFQTQECYPQYEQDILENREAAQERFARDLDQRFSLNNVERFYSSHYVDSQASSDSPEQKFDVSTLPPPLCSDDEND